MRILRFLAKTHFMVLLIIVGFVSFCFYTQLTSAYIHVVSQNTTQIIVHDKVNNIIIIDGDTIKGNIEVGRSIVLIDQYIRLLGYDAWECSRRRRTVNITDEELVKGKLAQVALSKLIEESVGVYLTDDGLDNYGRHLGYLRVIQEDGSVVCVEKWMKENGHQRTE